MFLGSAIQQSSFASEGARMHLPLFARHTLGMHDCRPSSFVEHLKLTVDILHGATFSLCRLVCHTMAKCHNVCPIRE